MTIIFKKHFVKNTENGKKCRVRYSHGKLIGSDKDCVTIYAKSYLDSLNGIIPYENDTDFMDDYFEKDRARIFEDSPYFQEVLKLAA